MSSVRYGGPEAQRYKEQREREARKRMTTDLATAARELLAHLDQRAVPDDVIPLCRRLREALAQHAPSREVVDCSGYNARKGWSCVLRPMHVGPHQDVNGGQWPSGVDPRPVDSAREAAKTEMAAALADARELTRELRDAELEGERHANAILDLRLRGSDPHHASQHEADATWNPEVPRHTAEVMRLQADAALGRALREAREAWGLRFVYCGQYDDGTGWYCTGTGRAIPLGTGITELEALQAALAAAPPRAQEGSKA